MKYRTDTMSHPIEAQNNFDEYCAWLRSGAKPPPPTASAEDHRKLGRNRDTEGFLKVMAKQRGLLYKPPAEGTP